MCSGDRAKFFMIIRNYTAKANIDIDSKLVDIYHTTSLAYIRLLNSGSALFVNLLRQLENANGAIKMFVYTFTLQISQVCDLVDRVRQDIVAITSFRACSRASSTSILTVLDSALAASRRMFR